MKILIAPDKFKGSLSALQVCKALAKGINKSGLNAEVLQCPLADGGDGSLDVLGNYLNLETISLETTDPLGRPISASYKKNEDTAFIELSAASGLVLLNPEERSATKTSSFGTGLLVKDAWQRGIQSIYLFIGGSATNDGGMGMAEALGYRFYDKEGKKLAPIGENLVHIAKIARKNLFFDPNKLDVKVICDVDNPLFGPLGAAFVYASQKGANKAEVSLLDKGLQNFAAQLKAQGFGDISQLSGAGAAGGIGGGAVALLGGQLTSGTQKFLEISGVESQIQEVDLLITGEGRLDAQTTQGKLISGLCHLAHQHNKPIVGVCGSAEPGVGDILGMERVYTVMQRSTDLADAMQHGWQKLVEIGAELGQAMIQ